MFKSKLGMVVPTAAMAVALGCSALAPVAAMAAPVTTVGDSTSIESNDQNAATADVPVTIQADGTWKDKDGTDHDMGKYVVTVPTSINVKGVGAGMGVDLSANYKVNVAGVIPENSKVTATATHDHHDSKWQFSVTQGKTEFTAKEISNGANDSKGVLHITGADSTDKFSTQQDVWYSDTVTGNITYNFALSK